MRESKINDSWIWMWGLVYLSCAIVKPDIFDGWPIVGGIILMTTVGCLMIFDLIYRSTTLGRILLITVGVDEVIGGVASWSGVVMWNVPFQDEAIFNVSMTVLDFLGAIMLF